MSTGLFTTAEIRARLDAGYPDWEDPDSDNWDWDNTLDDLINYGGGTDESTVRAFLKFLDVSARHEEPFAPNEFANELKQRYQGYWSDAAEFAREYAAPDWADMSDQPSARRETIDKFADFIDWAAYAGSVEFTDEWTVIALDGESGIHAFEEN